ncbi:hypothetical protein SSS_07628, partial [Sarcoptes scabiei]
SLSSILVSSGHNCHLQEVASKSVSYSRHSKMTRTKNKRSASLPSDSDNEFPKSKSKKTESYAEELLEPYLDDPEDSLSGLSLNEYLDINDLLFRFKDKKLIPRYLPVFEFASKQSKLLINKIQSANSEENLANYRTSNQILINWEEILM